MEQEEKQIKESITYLEDKGFKVYKKRGFDWKFWFSFLLGLFIGSYSVYLWFN